MIIFKRNVLLFITAASVSGLAGCASIVSSTSQSISVKTLPVTGAICSIDNNKGKWMANTSIGTVKVRRSNNALIVHCKKEGYEDADQIVDSKINPVVFGNILIGGIIGAGIDIIDGAAYSYPSTITVPMRAEG